MRLLLILTTLGLLGLAACSTDVDLNAPFKERPVIYAALDAGQDVQLVRIERSFLTTLEGNANVIAGNKDSLYYPSESLRVTLQPVSVTGAPISNLPAVVLTDTVIAKDTGLFAGGADQVVFRTPKGYKLAMVPGYPNTYGYHNYLLTISHPKLAQPVTAFTNIVPPLRPQHTGFLGDLIQPTVIADGRRLRSLGPTVSFNRLTDSVDRYQINFTIPVVEVMYPSPGTNDSAKRKRYIDWVFAPESQSARGSSNITVDKQSPNQYALFELLRLSLDSTDASVARRYIDTMDLRIITANNKISSFVDANRGYNVLTQTLPFYSNVNGGLGVFGSRNVSRFDVFIDPGFYNTSRSMRRYQVFKFRR